MRVLADLDIGTVKNVKRAIGMRKRLKNQFPDSETQFRVLPTDTLLELGKKSNAAFLEYAIPILKEKIEKGNSPYNRSRVYKMNTK